jgi:hypothetical protein
VIALKTYAIVYKVRLVHTFYVEANSEDEAEEEFDRLVENGEIDFSGGEVYDTSTSVHLINNFVG